MFSHWKFRSLPLGVLRDSHPGAWETVRTCNIGLYRADLESIGGLMNPMSVGAQTVILWCV